MLSCRLRHIASITMQVYLKMLLISLVNLSRCQSPTTGDSLVNKYNSKTGEYQYVDSRDSLVKMNLHLPKEELLYLHRKAADLGFWDFPSDERGDTSIRRNGMKAPRYVIEFNYKRKSKKVIFDASYIADPRLIDANQRLIKEITAVLSSEEQKQKSK